MADVKIVYGTEQALTTTALEGMASSATFTAGMETSPVDNSSNLFDDYLISGLIKTGTTPTVDKTIRIWVVPAYEDTPTWPAPIDGTSSAETWVSEAERNAAAVLAKVISVTATSNVDYHIGQFSVKALFGACPKHFTLFIAHDTVAALNATGSVHKINALPVYYTVG